MKNYIKTGLIVLSVIIIVALLNFLVVDYIVTKTFYNSGKTLDFCMNSIEKDASLDQSQIKIFEQQKDIFEKYLSEMETLKKGIFDSNTITFLSSFLLVFLGGILLGIYKWINDKTETVLSELQVAIKHFEIERMIMQLYTQIQMLRFFSTNLQNELASKTYCIDNATNIKTNEIFNMAESLLKDFHDGKYLCITKVWKSILVDIFERILNAFEMDAIRRETKNYGKTHPISMTINKLIELQREISRLREV